MIDRAFYNADGDLCIVPQLGDLDITTECGRLRVHVGEIALLPRALKFAVRLLSPAARGWIAESTGRPFKLPDRGPIGSAGLADERHFQVPTAWYEDREAKGYRLTVKFGGDLSEATLGFSPFDVVGWTGQVYV
jgi:homogentisate 1,2-dioxygenase